MKILLLLLIAGVLVSAPIWWKISMCAIHEHDYGVNTKWTLLSGCMIESQPGKFVPVKQYRGIVD